MFTSLSTTTCVSNILIGFPLPIWPINKSKLGLFPDLVYFSSHYVFACVEYMLGTSCHTCEKVTKIEVICTVRCFDYYFFFSNLDIFVLCFWFSGFAAAGNDRPTEDIDEDDDGVPGKFRWNNVPQTKFLSGKKEIYL